MVQTRSLMEKAVRAAIQRHLRGWAPYPNVQVTETQLGHQVLWRDANDILSAQKSARIETRGMPSRRNFTILNAQGERRWTRQDVHMMEFDEHLTASLPWTAWAAQKGLEQMSSQECSTMLVHLHSAARDNAPMRFLLELVRKQNFHPRNALHTALDALALASTPETRHVELPKAAPLARILVGHAMQSEGKAWACEISHSEGKWSDMAAVAWQHGQDWNLSIVPRNNPIIFCDYRWEASAGGLLFKNARERGAPEDTAAGRGSYERYSGSYHLGATLHELHAESIAAVLASPRKAVVEPDSVWLKPIVEGVKSGLAEKTPIAHEYYSLMRAFEEKAFAYLSSHARTPQGWALGACMTVSRSLEGPPQNVKEWQPRLLLWDNAIAGRTVEMIPISSDLWESPDI